MAHGARRAGQGQGDFLLVTKLHFVTHLSAQLHCATALRRAHRRNGIAGTRAFRDGVAERGGGLFWAKKIGAAERHQPSPFRSAKKDCPARAVQVGFHVPPKVNGRRPGTGLDLPRKA